RNSQSLSHHYFIWMEKQIWISPPIGIKTVYGQGMPHTGHRQQRRRIHVNGRSNSYHQTHYHRNIIFIEYFQIVDELFSKYSRKRTRNTKRTDRSAVSGCI
ncbi:MAG: hypothetical protein PVF94_11235, partial [Desulfobacterales bacterium]